MKHSFKKIVLIILDGFGLAPVVENNPVSMAKMDFLNSLLSTYQSLNVVASGLVVGLPWGKPGNSEVGHSAIGTGRVIIQDWARINADIKSAEFFKNPALLSAIEHCRKNNSQLHFVGCTSPGGIHAHEDHAIALLEFVAREQLPSVYLHMITDGEDAGPMESLATLQRLHEPLKRAGAKIATVIGRTYGMDRVLNWPLTQKAWDAMVNGQGTKIFDVATYLNDMHQKNIFDDQIPVAVVAEDKAPIATIKDNDAVIFFNYRNDRAKQLVVPFVTPEFEGFERTVFPRNLFIVTMTRYVSVYANTLPVNAVAYDSPDIHHTLGKEISRRNLKQFRVAEKEKEAHVNNFFNGGRLDPYEGTEQIIVASQQLQGAEYLEHPEMSARKITDELLSRKDQDFTLMIANFANADMMAHTGNIEATVEGLKFIDKCLERIAQEVLRDPQTALVITCDHGNSEEMIDAATGGPDTQHSTNNVIALFAGDGLENASSNSLEVLARAEPGGSLIDIAPTILHMLEFEKPVEMTGSTLI